MHLRFFTPRHGFASSQSRPTKNVNADDSVPSSVLTVFADRVPCESRSRHASTSLLRMFTMGVRSNAGFR